MHMEVEVRNLLVRSCTRRVPDAQPITGENAVNQSGDSRHSAHERCCRHVIYLAHVWKVAARDDENVSGVVLANIHERHGEHVRDDDARRYSALGDAAKDALLTVALYFLSGHAGYSFPACGNRTLKVSCERIPYGQAAADASTLVMGDPPDATTRARRLQRLVGQQLGGSEAAPSRRRPATRCRR